MKLDKLTSASPLKSVPYDKKRSLYTGNTSAQVDPIEEESLPKKRQHYQQSHKGYTKKKSLLQPDVIEITEAESPQKDIVSSTEQVLNKPRPIIDLTA